MAITIPIQGYCEATDVQKLVKHPQAFDANSVPSVSDVEAWITMDYNRINSMLRRIGYVVPVTVISAQLTYGGSLQLQTALTWSDTVMYLKDSTDSLYGVVLEGDAFKIAGDAQYYVATETVEADDAGNIVSFEIAPEARKSSVADTGVTHTPVQNAGSVLKDLNAHMVAARAEDTLISTGGGAKMPEFALHLRKLANEKWKQIETGQVPLIGASRAHKTTPSGALRLERRG